MSPATQATKAPHAKPALIPGPTPQRPALARVDAAQLQKDAVENTHVEQAPAVLKAPHRRILLVDDDAGVRGSLSEVLVSEGYMVIPAHDGQQAIQLAASIEVDLVLLDLNMPHMNGWDTFEQLTREHPLLPIIIVTARPNQLFTAVGAGAGALMEKPLDIPTLLATICRLVAEPDEVRLARLAGRETKFYYSARTP